MKNIIICCFLIASASITASAHDFWLEPHRYTAPPGKEIAIDWRIGKGFLGETLVFLPFNADRVEVWQDGRMRTLSPRFAGKPALKTPAPNEGAAVVVTVTPKFDLDYATWEEFATFVAVEAIEFDLPDAQEPPIREQYQRFSKTLISAEGDPWRDQKIGLQYEWVVADAEGSRLGAKLWYDGKPAFNHTVKIYRKTESETNEVEPILTRTNADGEIALSDLKAGEEVLLNAIHLEYQANEEWPWQSLWASTSFKWLSE